MKFFRDLKVTGLPRKLIAFANAIPYGNVGGTAVNITTRSPNPKGEKNSCVILVFVAWASCLCIAGVASSYVSRVHRT